MANRIAEAFIELKVKGEKAVVGALGRVKESAKGLGDGFDNALGRVGDKLDKATEGARKLQGAITGILGIVTVVAAAFFKLGNSIYEMTQQMRPASVRVKEFADEVRAAGGTASEQADAIRERLAELNKQAAELDGKILRIGLEAGDTKRMRILQEVAELNKELAKVNEREQQAVEVRNRREAKSMEEISRLRREALEIAKNDQQVLLETDPVRAALIQAEQERLRAARELATVRDQINEATKIEASLSSGAVASLQEEARLVEEISELRLRAIERELDAKLKAAEDAKRAEMEAERAAEQRAEAAAQKERERARETARIIAEANTQAAAETRQALLDAVSSINSDQGSFSQLSGLLSSIVDDVKQIRGRI